MDKKSVERPHMVDKRARIQKLEKDISLMKDYLQLRLQMNDWHGVRDAAADIEQLVSEIKELTYTD